MREILLASLMLTAACSGPPAESPPTSTNRVEVLDPPHAIAWKPGYDEPDGSLGFGGWTWRYDLRADRDDRTEVTLTYDWSNVPAETREHIPFPPFLVSHVENSLANLAQLAVVRT